MVDGSPSLANRTGSAIVLLLSASLLVGAADAPAERVVQLGETMPVTVNGQTKQLRIEPAAPGLVLLTQDYADAAALKMRGMFQIGAMYTVGNERVMASTAVARFAWGTAKADKRRIGWAARPYAHGLDAVIGPAGLDAPIVRFALHAPQPGERTVSLPMAPTGSLFGSWYSLRAEIMVGSERLQVRFDPHHRRTVANALAGQRIAATLGGRFDGPPVSEEIAFGIERPVRPMALTRPLDIGPLSLNRLGVRTVPDLNSGGSVAGIKEAGDPDEVVDPADVVVTGKRKKKHRPGTLTLGADQLDRCSSLVFDKATKEIRLTCA